MTLLSSRAPVSDEAVEEVFTHTDENGAVMHALVMEPAHAPAEPRPLLLYLHGWGQSGVGTTTNDLQCVKDAQNEGVLTRVRQMPSLSSCTILAPQCPPKSWWDVHRVWRLVTAFRSERHHVSLTVVGVSMGGCAVYQLIEAYACSIASAAIFCGVDDVRHAPLVRLGLYCARVPRPPAVDWVRLAAHYPHLPRLYVVHGTCDPLMRRDTAERCIRTYKALAPTFVWIVSLRDNPRGFGHHAWRAKCCAHDEWWAHVLSCETR